MINRIPIKILGNGFSIKTETSPITKEMSINLTGDGLLKKEIILFIYFLLKK